MATFSQAHYSSSSIRIRFCSFSFSTIETSADINPSLGMTSNSTSLPLTEANEAVRADNSHATFSYAGVEDLLEKISNVEGDTVTFRNVSDKDFDEIYAAREKMGRKFRLSLYTSESQVLIITIPTLDHECLHLHLNDIIGGILAEMNLQRELVNVGATDYPYLDHTGNRKSQGEGDSCRRPLFLRGRNDFPTLVIEAGYSQTWPSLRNKARWWFEASSCSIKIVLLIKLTPGSPDIMIEKWTVDQLPPTRPGRVTTRVIAAQNQPVFSPVCVQTIQITQAPGVSLYDRRRFAPSSYRVTRGLLRLEFKDLLLREPCQGEGDLILGTAELQEFASLVWKATA